MGARCQLGLALKSEIAMLGCCSFFLSLDLRPFAWQFRLALHLQSEPKMLTKRRVMAFSLQ